LKIEDYALIGDCHSAALVGRNGSIDWLCWPRFDSAACFAALLGDRRHGHWRISPSPEGPLPCKSRAYRPGTLVLETEFETAEGAVTVVDFMPVQDRQCDLVRQVIGRRGRVAIDMELVLRFDYGASVPWVSRLPDGKGLRAIAGPDMAVLRTEVPLQGRDLRTVAHFTVGEGESATFVLSHGASHLPIPPPLDAAAALRDTEAFWKKWSDRCANQGKWTEPVRRSLITLKALTYAPTGGIVAAPTTSLPEHLGGVRNWDYRFCWLRDATLTLLALMNAGYFEEAESWRGWLLRALAGLPEQVQIMYGIAGERRMPEWTLDWLPGYQASAPVRVGNAAASQLQLDTFGEMTDVLYQGCKGGLARNEATWGLLSALLAHLAKVWRSMDEGIWEVRGPRRHFTYSKVMAWVAFDRAVKLVEHFGMKGPVGAWRELRKKIHDDVCRNGFNAARGCFVQSYGSQELDASLLLIPLTGFLPASDPRVVATVKQIEEGLVVDGFVHRYRTRESIDGLPPGEGVFLACSFWLADNFLLQGRTAEAEALFERLLSLRNDVGLLSEEYDPAARRFLGNFPQAFSHVALVNTAMNLAGTRRPVEQRAEKKAEAA
jgi:GH15 family glucan-1,4-alpha-glucosidase